MLRRSTGFSEDMNRVGESRGKTLGSEPSKRNCVAIARFSVALDVSVRSDEVVEIGGVLVAIERRRLINGSAEASIC